MLLRAAPQTLEALAKALSVSTRTIRRDLAALQAVPLPITSRFEGDRHGVQREQPNVWALGETPAWPRREIAPVAEPSGTESADAVRS